MLAPLVLGLAFFVYSALSGLLTVYNSKIPENFADVNLKLENYAIKEIDKVTQKPKWILNSSHAEASNNETQAKIIDPELKYFAGDKGFVISSRYAYLDKPNQKVDLYDNAHLTTNDGKIEINAGKMMFSDADSDIGFANSWRLKTDSGYEISGASGTVSKDFRTIISTSGSKLSKPSEQLLLEGDRITIKPESDLSVIAEGNAVLNLPNNQKLIANKIDIYKDGRIKARGNVSVIATNINCSSENLEVSTNPDKSPKTGLFTGKPHVLQNNNTIYADLIKYDFATKLVSFEGNVHSGI